MIFDAHLYGDKLVYSASSPLNPPEVYEYSFTMNDIRKVTRVNEWLVEEVELVEPKHVRFKHNDLELDGWIMLPTKSQ